MGTVNASPIVASYQRASPPPLGLHAGPVVVAAPPDGDDHLLRAGALVATGVARDVNVACAIDPSSIYGWELGYGAFPRQAATAMIEERREQLRRAMGGAGVARYTVAIEIGRAPEVVTELADAADAALVVAGLGRHRPIDRLLGAETALRIVQRSHVPVLAVPPSFHTLPAIAVVGVDFSDAGWHAAACALPLLAPNATLHLVHVWQPSPSGDEAHAERHVHELPMHFHELTESLAIPEGMTVEHEVREGRVTDCLLEFAASHHADLIVVGRHGRGWLDRLRVGSVAAGVLRGASCAVLVVPEPPPHLREHAPVVHGRAGEHVEPDQWGAQVDAFSRRNAGRTTVLELSERDTGAFSQERGYGLFGVAYREEVNELDILLGEPNGRRRHLTNTLCGVSSLAIVRDADGSDHALRVDHAGGLALLTMVVA